MNLSTILSFLCFWDFLQISFSFVARPGFSRPVNQICRPSTLRQFQSFPLSVASKAQQVDQELTEEENPEEESKRTVIMNFVGMVRERAPGELEEDELVLLREVMTALPTDVGGEQGAQMIESLLYRLVDEWKMALDADDSEREEAWRPSMDDFKRAITAWEKSESPDTITRVLSILSDQRGLFKNSLRSIQPDRETFQKIFQIMASSRERGIDRRAWGIFDSLPDYGLFPDPVIYESMISICAKSRQRGAARQAEDLLREGVAKYPPQLVKGQLSGIGVNAINAVITAWAKSGDEDGPRRAEKLIVFMDEVDKENGSLGVCSPNVRSFTSLIDAYAQTQEWDGVCQCELTFNRLLDQYMDGNEDLEPTVATWTIVISAWAKLSKKNYKSAADKSHRLLKRMESLHRDNRISFGPDAITYVSCMNAFVFSKESNGPPRAEAILDEMNEKYIDGDDTMKPSSRSVKIVIDAWIKKGQMERAEDLLDRYEDLLAEDDSPRTFDELQDIYRSMLFGWGKSDDPERAQFYLTYMIEKGMQPDSFCFDRVIEANTHKNDSGALKRSYAAFELMEKCRREGTVQPNERIYTSLIRALAKGKAPNVPKKASLLLQRMQELYNAGNEGIKPTVFTYNAVLYACAESLADEDTSNLEAFKIAVGIFSTLRRKERLEKADHVSFGNMLRCAPLLPEGEKKDALIKATFRLCCDSGFVNSYIVRDIQYAASEELWRSLLNCPQGDVDMDRFPPDWTSRFEVKKPAPRRDMKPRGRDMKPRRGSR